MKRASLLAAALLAAAPVLAQDFLGMTSDDVAAMVGRARADQRLERLKELGRDPSGLPSIGKALGFTKTLASRQDCIFDAVESRLGVSEIRSGTEFPDVLFASDVDAARYRAAVKAQYPSANPGEDVATIYLSDFNVIYVADSARVYAKGGSMDGALAGEYARFLDRTQRDVSDAARLDADAAAVSAWYDSSFPGGRSSCAP